SSINNEGGIVYFGCSSGVILAFSLFSVSLLSFAATPVLTQEQLQKLRQLPAAEREALLRAPGRPGKMLQGAERVRPGPSEVSPTGGIELNTIEEPPRIKGGDTILVTFTPIQKTAPTPQEKKQMPIPGQKIFILDQFGALVLPDAGRIILAGLDEEEAAARLGAEPVFEELIVKVKLLPVEKELKAFGYQLFTRAPESFAPATDIPIPADYVVGPGDTVLLQLFGKQNVEYELVITRDGLLLFPDIGPIPVAGLKFSQLRRRIHSRVQKQFIGVKASVTLGRLRSIRVFVLGDVKRPGSYTVSGLSTLTNALFASGGIKKVGSLRDIQLKRRGKTISRMDLYDLLLRGDTRADVRLLPGDVIFVPPIRRTAAIAGWVRRPAIYELKNEITVGDLITMAGGLLPDAFAQAAQIKRILANGERTLLDVDLTQREFRKMTLHDGDVVRIASALDRVEHMVTLSGHVQRPGDYQWKPGMRLTDLVSSTSALMPEVDARYLLVKRENPINRHIELLSTNLEVALENPEGRANIRLQPRDEVRVFDIHSDRSAVIEPLLDRITAQSSPNSPVPEVSVIGTVHHPGRYPLSSNMKVSDLLRAAGGLTDRAYTLEAELTRFRIVDGKKREQSRWALNIADLLTNDESPTNIALTSYDQINVRRVPQWDEVGSIEIIGEARFPGHYLIARGESLSNVLKRAGGLTDQAYPRGVVFIRESVREREQEQLDQLTLQLERDIVSVVAQGEEFGVDKRAALAEARLLLDRIR
ncbi:MAG: SLBB domain-containing protein, partial [Gammaproteobacteria bacterium]